MRVPTIGEGIQLAHYDIPDTADNEWFWTDELGLEANEARRRRSTRSATPFRDDGLTLPRPTCIAPWETVCVSTPVN